MGDEKNDPGLARVVLVVLTAQNGESEVIEAVVVIRNNERDRSRSLGTMTRTGTCCLTANVKALRLANG